MCGGDGEGRADELATGGNDRRQGLVEELILDVGNGAQLLYDRLQLRGDRREQRECLRCSYGSQIPPPKRKARDDGRMSSC